MSNLTRYGVANMDQLLDRIHATLSEWMNISTISLAQHKETIPPTI